MTVESIKETLIYLLVIYYILLFLMYKINPKLYYRYIYMGSVGWKLTRWLRKKDKCQKCGAVYNLHLHHEDYNGYWWWNLLLPDLISKMKTLCSKHHVEAHSSRFRQ